MTYNSHHAPTGSPTAQEWQAYEIWQSTRDRIRESIQEPDRAMEREASYLARSIFEDFRSLGFLRLKEFEEESKTIDAIIEYAKTKQGKREVAKKIFGISYEDIMHDLVDSYAVQWAS